MFIKIIKDAYDQKKDFLIIEKEPYFAQVAFSQDGIWVEIISNDFLPIEQKLTPEKINQILSLGFHGAVEANYCKNFPTLNDATFNDVSTQIFQIFNQIFGIPIDAELKIDMQ